MDDKDIIFTRVLDKPVTAHGAEIASIAFRAPFGADIARFGNPVIFNPFDPSADPTFNAASMTRMLAHLSNVNPGAIEAMTGNDWTSCAWGIAGFFLPTVQKPASI